MKTYLALIALALLSSCNTKLHNPDWEANLEKTTGDYKDFSSKRKIEEERVYTLNFSF